VDRCVACHPTARKILKTSHAALGANACDGCHPAHKDLPAAPSVRSLERSYSPGPAVPEMSPRGRNGPGSEVAEPSGAHP